MIQKYADKLGLTEYIERLGYETLRGNSKYIKVYPKPYTELEAIFGKSGNMIDTPWTTVQEMEGIFLNGGTITIELPTRCSTRHRRGLKHYLVNRNGWSYPSGAFNISTEYSNIKNIKELKV